MIRRRTALGMLASLMVPGLARATGLTQSPMLDAAVAAGDLPEMAMRLPEHPRVVNVAAMGRKPGRHGGTIRTLIGSQKDIRLMTIQGYARLVGYDQHLNLQADILDRFENDDDRVFTFHIRKGHRWSNGALLTAEDFRYCWEDVILNEDLRKGSLPTELLGDGKPPRFEVIDEFTVRYSWDAPNPDFLPKLAAPQPLVIVMPSGYMRTFHKKYQDPFRLAALVKEYQVKKWTSLHIKMSSSYRPENPELPTLDPWRNTVTPPAEQFVFTRNPYFHRVDENGLQLPYVDQVILSLSTPDIIAAKAGSGESDLQANNLDFADYTFLKDSEKLFPVKVSLWKRTQGSRVALLPNLNCGDEVWRGLFRDVRMRRALSLAIDRREINLAAFYGLARESADTMLEESPLYSLKFAKAWSNHDPAEANRLLDELGLTKRNDDGIRLLPDGRKAEIIVETAGESTLETDVLELVTDHWREVGLSLFIRTSQRDVFRSRAMGGEIMMSMWLGLDNGVATADMNPGELAPTADDQLQWPVWGMYYLSVGKKGKPPEVPEARRLVELVHEWHRSPTMADRKRIWTEMLDLYTDQVFSIGIVNGGLQPVLHATRLQNVPEQGLFGFEPTSYLGIYQPDTFWMSEEG
nr:ABC transporter substrate-binding protein [uncultured Gellertiella sp.]